MSFEQFKSAFISEFKNKSNIFRILIVIAFITIIVSLVFALIHQKQFRLNQMDSAQSLSAQELRVTARDYDKKIKVEVARTDSELEKGLMFRDKIGEASGMIFIFDKPSDQYFWMKNTKISLDIIFFDENGNFINVAKNAEPCPESLGNSCPNYKSEKPSRYVLETMPGFFSSDILNQDMKIEVANL